MGVQPRAADRADLAGLAFLGQSAETDLTCRELRQQEGRVEGIPRYMEPGPWRVLIGRLQRIGLLDASVRLDDDETGRRQADSLAFRHAAEQQVDELFEEPDTRLPGGGTIPALEYGDQPSRVGRQSGIGPVRR